MRRNILETKKIGNFEAEIGEISKQPQPQVGFSGPYKIRVLNWSVTGHIRMGKGVHHQTIIAS